MSEEELRIIFIEIIRFQTDPFYNECCAYDRLTECHVNGKIAVRCHGHMPISDAREEELDRRFAVYAWSRPEGDSELSVSKRQSFRAIVKDLIEDDLRLNEKQLIKMHNLGVYPQDVQERNHGGGLLLDFSIAITKPYWVFETKMSWWIRTLKNRDMNMLQVIILDSKNKDMATCGEE